MKRFLFAILCLANYHLQSFSQCSVNLGNDTSVCAGQNVNLAINVQYFEDSLVITYDATQGQTQLVGANKVYIHSAAEIVPFGGWQYTTGNWGIDDSIGLMKNIGTDLWQITIHPKNYYSYPGNFLNGIFMVFRNFDGTLTGRDNTGNDIWMDMAVDPPTSAFTGVTGLWKRDAIESILWSTGDTLPNISVNSSGNYFVLVLDTNNCTASDTINVSFSPQINLGNDTAYCAFPVNLDAGAGFVNYVWNGTAGAQNFTANSAGTYSVLATTSDGCQSSDTIILSSGILQISLGNDTGICGMETVILDAGVVISPFGDSIIIQYDATKGQTQLMGAAKVYMHAGAELHQFGGWQYVTGNWGQDDGVGEMQNIGTDLWQFTIQPQSYFNYPPDSSVWGIFMVFRNEDGTQTGKDDSGNDIWMDTKTNPPTNGFNGVSAQWKGLGITNILWSDGSANTTLLVSSTALYSVTVTDMYGCSASDTINIFTSGLPFVDIGTDQEFCSGSNIILDADTGFTSYLWSTNDTTQTITVTTSGTYSITVTNSSGCEGIDVVTLTAENPPVASFTYVVNGMTVDFTSASQNDSHFYWHFFGTPFIHDSTDTTPSFTYAVGGTYDVYLVVSNSCGSDTMTQSITVVGIDETGNSDLQFAIYPNPNDGKFNVQISEFVNIGMKIYNILGKNVYQTQNLQVSTNLPQGIYFVEITFDEKKSIKKLTIH